VFVLLLAEIFRDTNDENSKSVAADQQKKSLKKRQK
jgi:hypothetical protein